MSDHLSNSPAMTPTISGFESHDDRKRALLERLQRLESYLATDPGNMQLLSDAFETAISAGEFDRAEALLAQGNASGTDTAAWKFKESNLRIAQRRLDEAWEVLQALQQNTGAHPAIIQNLAFIAFLQQQYKQCYDLLRPLIDETSNGAADSSLQVLWLRTLHRLTLLQEALNWYDRQIANNTLASDAAGVASLICIDADRLEQARQLSEQALKANPQQIEALVARASVALALRDANGARQLLTNALQQNPQDGRSWSALGFAEMLAGDLDKATQHFRQAVVFMPAHIGTWHGLGWARLMSRDIKEARDAFEQALSLDRNFGESHGAMAVVQALQGEREQALQSIERAKRLDKAGLSAHYAESILSGEASDAQAMQRLAQRLLGDRKGPLGGTMADWLPQSKH